MTTSLTCVRCHKPVEENAELYEVFERMHWLCFHLEFEHEGDADKPCADPSCPWWHIQVYREKLEHLGFQPDAVIEEAVAKRWT